MFNSKYSKFLTAMLIVVIILIVGLLIFLGIDYYKKYNVETGAEDALGQLDSYINGIQDGTTQNKNEQVDSPNIDLNNLYNEQIDNSQSSSEEGVMYKGYRMIGKIEIPKIDVKYPVLSEATPGAIEIAIGKLYGPGLNKPGNTVLVGHNFRNGTFFSNNKKLVVGDKIYITDLEGKKVTYEIYKKYTTSTSDFKYAERDTNGKRELSLSTCTDDTSNRLIIWAKEK